MKVSVPIRGLFNLTVNMRYYEHKADACRVSVPIRGLFNLTSWEEDDEWIRLDDEFPSPSGDYLI